MTTKERIINEISAEYDNQLYYIKQAVITLQNGNRPDFGDLKFTVELYNDKVRIVNVYTDCFNDLELFVLNQIHGMSIEEVLK